MTRFLKATTIMAVAMGILAIGSATAGPFDPPYPSRIDFPAPTVNPTTGVVTTNFSAEGMAVSGDTFYAGNTQTGEIIKGNLRTGAYDRNWVPPSPNQPSELHRGLLGLLVDDHNRLWVAGSYGIACGGNNQAVCPAGVTSPAVNYGVTFVYDATTGAQLAQYTLTSANSKTINDMTISGNAVYFSNTTAPSTGTGGVSNGSEVQFKLQLLPGGALPPGDVPATAPPRAPANPAVTNIPTPGFVSADGIDTLANGNIAINSVSGNLTGNNSAIIVIDKNTLTVTKVTVTTPNEPGRLPPPLLSGDGTALDGNLWYYPENRQSTAACPAPNAAIQCPGDWAVVRLIPPDYTTAEVVTRLNSPPGSGLPPLRQPANMEQLGHLVYGIVREVLPNPVTGALNVTQFFIQHLDKLPIAASGAAVSAVEGASSTGSVATFTDPNSGQTASSFTATINWGDGTPATPGTVTGSSGVALGAGGPGSFTAGGTHTYAEEGTYTVKTTITDAITSFTLGTTTSTATVTDAALTPGAIDATCVSGE